MGVVREDIYGHVNHLGRGTPLAGAAVGVTTPGTIAGSTNAGAAPTVDNVSAVDMGGRFNLNPVTGGGAQAAGEVVTVNFANPFDGPPTGVLTTVFDITTAAAPAATAHWVSTLTANKFSIETAALTTAHIYRVTFQVIP